jgi:hypothetical protein
MAQDSVKPTTTSEQDLHAASRRQINRIWEVTQATIAILVTLVTLFVAAAPVFVIRAPGLDISGERSGTSLLANAFFLVIGFYFGRTNHSRIGDAAMDPQRHG